MTRKECKWKAPSQQEHVQDSSLPHVLAEQEENVGQEVGWHANFKSNNLATPFLQLDCTFQRLHNFPKISPLAEKLVLKHMDLWGTFLFQII